MCQMPAGLEGRVQPRPITGFLVFCSSQSTAEARSRRCRVCLAEPSVLPPSCRQLKLVFGRLGAASRPFSVAGTLVQRAWNVPGNGYGRDARPHAPVFLPGRRGSAGEGRARSPLRAGAGRADPASRPESLPSAPLRARLRRATLPFAGATSARMAARQSAQRRRESVGRVPRVRDAPPSVHPERSGGQRAAPPYQRSGFDEAKPAAQMWMSQSGGCKISAAKKQSGRHSKSRVGRRCFVQANCPARFGLHQTLADMEVVPPTEPKAVLEHRAPKISPPILHTRGVESKVGRAAHCAPGLLVRTRSFGLNPVLRALTSAATFTAEALSCRESVGLRFHTWQMQEKFRTARQYSGRMNAERTCPAVVTKQNPLRKIGGRCPAHA